MLFRSMEKSPMLDAIARQSVLFEEFLIAEHSTGRLELAFQDGTIPNVLLHGHCHQKAHGVMGPVQAALELVPGLDVEVVDSSCCGMAGSFGYHRETSGRGRGWRGRGCR